MKYFDHLLKKFSLKQIAIFFICIITIQVAAIIATQVYQDNITHDVRARRLVGYGTNLVTWLGQDLKHHPEDSQKDINALQISSQQDALFSFSLSDTKPQGYIIKDDMIGFDEYNQLIHQFKSNDMVTISKYYPELAAWGNFTFYNRDSFVIHNAMIIMMIIYLITILLLLLIFMGYRRLLPLWLFRISVGEVQKHTAFQPSDADLQTIETMRTTINKLINDKTLLLSALSHDLKTPLSSAYICSKIISKKLPKEAAQLQGILDEIQTVIDVSLDFAEVQYQCDVIANHNQQAFSIVETYRQLRQKYQQEPVSLHFNTNDRVMLYGNAELFHRALTNLIHNALKHAHSCQVTFSQDKNTLIVKVEDQGPGIDPSQLKHILDPYYSDKTDQSKALGGHGLGLAIVKLITEIHQGQITIENAEPTGLIVELSFPLIIFHDHV